MKAKISKMAMLFIVAILMMSMVGAAYAMWSKTLIIDGTLNTGELDAIFTDFFGNDPPGQIDPGYTKDVGSSMCWIDDTDPQKAYITITNGYPSYRVSFSADITNTGTIPWKMTAVKVDGQTLTSGVWKSLDLDGDGDNDIEFLYINGEGKQIDQGFTVEFSLKIHVLQGAEQDFTYTFTVEAIVVQWNEP